MSGNNIKLLTKDEMKRLNEFYEFKIFDDMPQFVFVCVKGTNKRTAHLKSEPFKINNKIRILTFSPETVRIWEELGTNKYSLIDVQNACNTLYVLYQPITKTNVKFEINEMEKENG